MNMIFDVAAMSDMGLVRKNNEDNLFVPGAPMKDRLAEDYSYIGKTAKKKAFFCICDGMGGHNAGEIASDIAVNQVKLNYDTIVDNVSNIKELEAIMSGFVKNANLAICDFSAANPECANMGTTMCGIFFMNGTAYCVNVGDSRLYYLKGTKAVQLSIDHADTVHTNAITRYLGMPEEYGDVTPDVGDLPIKLGTRKRFLLCSDGLSDMLKDESIADILYKEKAPADAARKLIEEAKRMGGRDNITVVVIDAKPKSAVTRMIKSPIFAVMLAVAIIAGGTGGYMYYKASLPVEGINLDDAKKKLSNSKNIEGAMEEIKKFISDGEAAVNDATIVSEQRPEIEDEAVKQARETLNVNIENTKAAIEHFTTEIDRLTANTQNLSPEEGEALLNELKNFDSMQTGTMMVNCVRECFNAKTNLTNAIANYDKKEAQKKAAQNKSSDDNKKPEKKAEKKAEKKTNNIPKTPVQEKPVKKTEPAQAPASAQTNSATQSDTGGMGEREK